VRNLLFYSLLLIFGWIKAQVGGRNSFESLSLNENSRVLGIGGENISTSDYDVNSFLYNPASLNDEMVGSVSLNYLPFYADVKKVSTVGAFNSDKIGKFGVGIQYLSFGKFEERDINGVPLGEFNAGEIAIALSKSHQLGPIVIGGNMKFVSSRISNYNASALVFDLGGMFKHPEHQLEVGMLFKNFGFVLGDYTDERTSSVPFNLQLGASYKPEHMPVRFSITGTNLNVRDVQYLDEERDVVTQPDGEKTPEEKKLSEQIFRRLIFGTEFIFSNNFHLRMGYNHQRRKELRLDEKSGGAGFSFGFMVRIKKIEFDYSKVYYHVVGGTNVITISLNIKESFGSKRVEVDSEL